jgi:hypothetical protein
MKAIDLFNNPVGYFTSSAISRQPKTEGFGLVAAKLRFLAEIV